MKIFGIDLKNTFSNLLLLLQSLYHEYTDPSISKIPQPNCGRPCTQPTLYNFVTNSSQPYKERLISGEDALPNSYPWMVSIRAKPVNLSHFCGGALLYSQYVLTAAHCTFQKSPEVFSVAVGLHTTNRLNKNDLYDVVEIKNHPYYIDKLIYNDIAILKLAKPVQISNIVSTICLPDSENDDKEIYGKNVALSGW
jgi:hypothetical protein